MVGIMDLFGMGVAPEAPMQMRTPEAVERERLNALSMQRHEAAEEMSRIQENYLPPSPEMHARGRMRTVDPKSALAQAGLYSAGAPRGAMEYMPDVDVEEEEPGFWERLTYPNPFVTDLGLAMANSPGRKGPLSFITEPLQVARDKATARAATAREAGFKTRGLDIQEAGVLKSLEEMRTTARTARDKRDVDMVSKAYESARAAVSQVEAQALTSKTEEEILRAIQRQVAAELRAQGWSDKKVERMLKVSGLEGSVGRKLSDVVAAK